MAKYDPTTTLPEIATRLADALKDHEPFWPFPYFYTDMMPVDFNATKNMAIHVAMDARASKMTSQKDNEFNLEPGQLHQVINVKHTQEAEALNKSQPQNVHDELSWTVAQETQTREFRYSVAVRIQGCDPFCVLLLPNEAHRLKITAEVSCQCSAFSSMSLTFWL
jgi:hypothetical protein